jgi:diadenosine tetraphosphate (Ap4A) HIT family hydrolase
LALRKGLTVFQLVIPKHHGAKLTDIPDDQLSEILPVVKKLASASGAENYNLLQNNGRLAHQVVDHVRGRLLVLWNEFCTRMLTGLAGSLSHDPQAKRRGRDGNLLASKEGRHGQVEATSGSAKSENVTSGSKREYSNLSTKKRHWDSISLPLAALLRPSQPIGRNHGPELVCHLYSQHPFP